MNMHDVLIENFVRPITEAFKAYYKDWLNDASGLSLIVTSSYLQFKMTAQQAEKLEVRSQTKGQQSEESIERSQDQGDQQYEQARCLFKRTTQLIADITAFVVTIPSMTPKGLVTQRIKLLKQIQEIYKLQIQLEPDPQDKNQEVIQAINEAIQEFNAQMQKYEATDTL